MSAEAQQELRGKPAAMSGPLDERQASAALLLWVSGHFDTFDISAVLHVGEDAVCRTIHAARSIRRAAE